jgi:hypothetical protein
MSLNDLIREGYWPANSIPTLPVTSGLEFYLDASVAASVDVANQLWKNLVTSPASGAAQTDYDFQMGANTTSGDSDEPLHVGTPMSGHPFAYWNMGGDDGFIIPSNTSFINSLHKDGATFTLIAVASLVLSGASSQRFLATSNGLSNRGIQFQIKSSQDSLQFVGTNGSSTTINTETDNPPTSGLTDMFGISVDENGGASGSFFYASGDYLVVGGSNTFDGAYSSPSSSNATRAAAHWGTSGAGGQARIGTRDSAFIAYNRALTKSEMDQLYRHFKAQGRV